MNRFIYNCIIVFSTVLNLNCFFNPYIDGPKVISAADADDRFKRALSIILYFADPDLASSLAISNSESDVLPTCSRNRFYFLDAVDYCEQSILQIKGVNVDDIFLQYFATISFVCDLRSAQIFNSRAPLQGEIDFCSALGM